MSGGASAAPFYGVYAPPKQIVNGYSSNGWTPASGTLAQVMGPGISQAGSGALTANTLKPVISLTGPGLLDLLFLTINTSTNKTTRVQIVIDGVTAFDSTSVLSFATGGTQILGIAGSIGGVLVAQWDPIVFKSSCVVSVAASVAESNTYTFSYKWRPL